MPIYAVIRDGKVENTVLWDGQAAWQAPEGTETVRICDEDVPAAGSPGIGWDYADGKFADNRPVEEFEA